MNTLTPTETAHSLADSAFVHFDGALHASYSLPDFAAASGLVAQIGAAAERVNHHPDLELSWGRVGVTLSSHDAGGVTERDIELAAAIQRLAREAGASPSTASPTRYEFAIDTADVDGIREFWRVGLDYVDGGEGSELVDPRGKGPRLWFQRMAPPRTDRNRIHVDVYVPTPDAAGRVRAILAAGGTLMTDEFAPDWWVLADAEGNELCVCTVDP